jgi:hypothetical protein
VQALHARIRRYTSPDEHAFFPAALPVRHARVHLRQHLPHRSLHALPPRMR